MAKNSSFLPEDYLDRKIARRTNLICIALFLVMIGAIGAAFYVQGRQDDGTRTELARVNATFSERALQLRQIEQLQERKQQMIGKAKIVQQLVERVPRSIILAEMINHMPSTLSLLELELETSIVKPGARPQTAIERDRLERSEAEAEANAEVTIAPREITIEVVGVAPNDNDVSVFMENLSVNPLFTGVGLEFIERHAIEGNDMRRFRIVMQLNMELTFDRDDVNDATRSLEQNPMANEDHTFNGAGDEPGEVADVPTQTD
ncbi:MAG: PilN domain-containing protein [Phycisphaerales bacterium JB063]